MLWERHVIAENVSKRLISAFALEGCSAEEHFVNQYAERPPVDCASMTAAFDDFRCNVFFCTDERVGTKVGYAGFCVDRR